MDLILNWKGIQDHFNRSFKSSLHVSIASVKTNGEPSTTPIGSFFLTDNQKAFYFEKFTTSLSQNENSKVCILGVNSSKSYWLKSLIRIKFDTHPAIKLYGTLGEKRKATDSEIALLEERMKNTRFAKGNHYLWGDMKEVREVHIERAEKINIGKMTEQL